MAFVQADVDALDAAYKSGAEGIRTADGRAVNYRTIEEYRALRAFMLEDIAIAAGGTAIQLVRVGIASGVE